MMGRRGSLGPAPADHTAGAAIPRGSSRQAFNHRQHHSANGTSRLWSVAAGPAGGQRSGSVTAEAACGG